MRSSWPTGAPRGAPKGAEGHVLAPWHPHTHLPTHPRLHARGFSYNHLGTGLSPTLSTTPWGGQGDDTHFNAPSQVPYTAGTRAPRVPVGCHAGHPHLLPTDPGTYPPKALPHALTHRAPRRVLAGTDRSGGSPTSWRRPAGRTLGSSAGSSSQCAGARARSRCSAGPRLPLRSCPCAWLQGQAPLVPSRGGNTLLYCAEGFAHIRARVCLVCLVCLSVCLSSLSV